MSTLGTGGGDAPPRQETYSPRHGGRTLAASVLQFDLPTEIAQLRLGRTYERGGPSGRTLLKEPDLRVVLMTLQAGGRMEEHSASGPTSIHVIEGSIRVHVADGQGELGPGSLLTMESAVRHEVEAVEDSAFLLTIGRTKYERVSDSHEP
jgi:quercetin dioxygenase-like cupin family protein